MSVAQERCSIWEAIDFYFSEIPEGETGLDSRRSADKQLQNMAEAVLAKRPGDIRLDSTIQPNETFKTQRMDTQLDFNRFIDVLKTHNQLEPTLTDPISLAPPAEVDPEDTKGPVHQLLRQRALRCVPNTRAEAEQQELAIHEERAQGAHARAHQDLSKAPEPPANHKYLDVKLSERYPDPKKPYGQVHGSLDNVGRKINVYATKGSKQTGVQVVQATVLDVPHWREIGSAAISLYSFLIVKKDLPHARSTLDAALWHSEIEWEAVTRIHQAKGQGLPESRQDPLPSPDWRSISLQRPPSTGRPFGLYCTWVDNTPASRQVEIRVKGLKTGAAKNSKYMTKNKKDETVPRDTHARVTGPFLLCKPNAPKPPKGSPPNREGLENFHEEMDKLLYHLLVRLDYPMRAAIIHVAWRALAYRHYPGRSIPLFDDPEYQVRVSYYRVATSSRKWADPEKPEYNGHYHFEICGEIAYFYCSTYANVTPPDVTREVPKGLGIQFSENLQAELKGKAPNAIVDGMTASAHLKLQECIRFLICTLFELKRDVKAMRIALYKFNRRITLNPRRPSGAARCRSPFIIDGKNNAVFLNQNFSFGNIIDDFPMTPDKRLYTGVQLGKLSVEEKRIILREINEAYRTFDSFIAAITVITLFVDAWREVDGEDDTPIFESKPDFCDHPDMDKSHVCQDCGDIVHCHEIANDIQDGIFCARCVGDDEAVADDKTVSIPNLLCDVS